VKRCRKEVEGGRKGTERKWRKDEKAQNGRKEGGKSTER
jgi:hypothetical protein